jgi:hypothetical protein
MKRHTACNPSCYGDRLSVRQQQFVTMTSGKTKALHHKKSHSVKILGQVFPVAMVQELGMYNHRYIREVD